MAVKSRVVRDFAIRGWMRFSLLSFLIVGAPIVGTPLMGAPLVGALVLSLSIVMPSKAQTSDPLVLAMPQTLLDSGFMKHLLPRFRFKTRISITPTAETSDEANNAAMSLVAGRSGDGSGESLFLDEANTSYSLAILSDDEAAQKKSTRFLDWLQSDPGKAAIEGFKPDGKALFRAGVVEVVEEEEIELEGDVALGSELALIHCGRCHVIDDRNPFGGIGSTPSFGALRGTKDWQERFSAFWTYNPHPAFTQVEDITEPFDPMRPPSIAPLEMTLEEVEAIAAFAATMEPKQLGGDIDYQ